MALTKEQQNFVKVAPGYMHQLMEDFPSLTVLDAAAVFGNAGYESKGLTDDQEDAPTVRGSRGGLNWMQWTGPRRRAMEAYCNRNKLDANSDVAAYKWLWNELKGPEKKAIPALARGKTLEEKVKNFEMAFLRAGVKHYDRREDWANLALSAYNAAYAAEGSARDTSSGESEEPATAGGNSGAAPKVGAPSWLAGVLIVLFAALVGVSVWLWGGLPEILKELAPPEEVPDLLGNTPRLLGMEGSTKSILWQAVLMPLVLSFVQPLIAAAAAWMTAQISYWWFRLLKAKFDTTSSERLHKALENAIYAGLEIFGPKATNAKLQSFASDYAQTYNKGDVKRFKLTDGELQELALPHIGKARKKG